MADTATETDLLTSLRSHLEGLKRTPDGRALHSLIERALERSGARNGQLEQAFLDFLDALLTRCVADPKYGPVTRVKARLIQQRLAVYRHRADPPAATAAPDAPPLSAKSADQPVPATTADSITPVILPASDNNVALRAGAAAESPAAPPPQVVAEAIPPKPPSEPPPAEPEPTAFAAARETVEEFAAQVGDTLADAETLARLESSGQAAQPRSDLPWSAALDSIQSPMNRIDAAIKDFGDLKQMLVRGLDDLIREREELQHRLSASAGYLRSLEDDRTRLQAELAHARKHGQADELTGLPRRDLFVRSLEAEIGRVRRYGFALTLALVDIDGLSQVNEQYGRDAGDAVLRQYAREIFSRFRAYDLVTRYEDDSFAVLFPNTQKEGAQQALEKARQRAAETVLTHEGHSLPLPSFSSVVTVYSPGEKVTALLARAAEALDRAKLRGPRQAIVALPAV
jgi:diguanylate cyclase (GGDEF)-like protein